MSARLESPIYWTIQSLGLIAVASLGMDLVHETLGIGEDITSRDAVQDIIVITGLLTLMGFTHYVYRQSR